MSDGHEPVWNVTSLKEFVDQRFTDQDKAVQAALLAAEKAVIKAENAANERFRSVNEFRTTLSDQTATFIPRTEADQRFVSLTDKITDLADRINTSEGSTTSQRDNKNDMYRAVATGVSVLGLIITLVVLIANGKI
jgi:hypothetical protein